MKSEMVQKVDFYCYVFQKIVIYNDKRQINDKATKC